MIRWFERHSGVSWIITIFGAAAIFYVSSLEFAGGGIGGTNFLAIAYHISAFFCFSAFLLISMIGGKRRNFIFPAVLIAVAYAVSDEIHQFFVPSRSCTLFDVWLDSIGIVFALMIYGIILVKRKMIKQNESI